MTTSSPQKFAVWFMAIALLLAPSGLAWGKTTLASPFTDNMVLQRERPLAVWGWAEPGEAITVAFAGQKKTTATGSDGRWMLKLDPLKASSEPAELTASGANTIVVRNVLVGEVWLCGGQSNMGLTLQECFDAPREIAAANYPQIRFLAAAAAVSLLPADRLAAGSWRVCTPETAAGFAEKMKAMIVGWRQAWGAGDFPFYFVQLANEGNPNQDPAEDETFRYVPVREAQRRVLELPHTGMVVAIDLPTR